MLEITSRTNLEIELFDREEKKFVHFSGFKIQSSLSLKLEAQKFDSKYSWISSIIKFYDIKNLGKKQLQP